MQIPVGKRGAGRLLFAGKRAGMVLAGGILDFFLDPATSGQQGERLTCGWRLQGERLTRFHGCGGNCGTAVNIHVLFAMDGNGILISQAGNNGYTYTARMRVGQLELRQCPRPGVEREQVEGQRPGVGHDCPRGPDGSRGQLDLSSIASQTGESANAVLEISTAHERISHFQQRVQLLRRSADRAAWGTYPVLHTVPQGRTKPKSTCIGSTAYLQPKAVVRDGECQREAVPNITDAARSATHRQRPQELMPYVQLM